MSAYWPSLIGGTLLGLSAVALLLLDGRVVDDIAHPTADGVMARLGELS